MEVVILFIIIAAMRVIQACCNKNTSLIVTSNTLFFKYAAYYQIVAALVSCIVLLFSGFNGLNTITVICAACTAVLFMADLFTGIEAIKGGTLILATMFSMGGLFIPCIVGIFLFNEPMSIFQWLGIGIFILSACLLVSGSKSAYKRFSLKTLIMLVINMLVNGMVMVVQKYFALLVPDGNVIMFSFVAFSFNSIILIIGLSLAFIFRNRAKTKHASENVDQSVLSAEGQAKKPYKLLPKTLWICGALLAFAIFMINQLVTTLAKTVPSAILFPISSAISIMITTAIGRIIFKEKLSYKNLLGLALGFISILIINFL